MFIFSKEENGSTAIEYGLISSLMASLILVNWGRAYTSVAGVTAYIVEIF
jgi:Flp pilus assembly pilin Flp